MYSTGAVRSVNSRNAGVSLRPGSKTTRSGCGPGTWRVVSCGSSAATVPAPTTTASHNARIRCRWTMLSPPVTVCESPDGVAMNPSRLWPRWPTVSGRADVALQMGRYKFSRSDRGSSAGRRDSHPSPGCHASTPPELPGVNGRKPSGSASPNSSNRPLLSSPSANWRAARSRLQAESTADARCSTEALSEDM